jgi:hypothetical protein
MCVLAWVGSTVQTINQTISQSLQGQFVFGWLRYQSIEHVSLQQRQMVCALQTVASFSEDSAKILSLPVQQIGLTTAKKCKTGCERCDDVLEKQMQGSLDSNQSTLIQKV